MLRGQARPDGLGAIVYHGLLQGLAVILRASSPLAPMPRHRRSILSCTTAPAFDPQLVGLLANMFLQVHSEFRHVL